MATISTAPLALRLEDILSSLARVRVARLVVQLPDKEFTGREIGRMLSLSHSTVQEAMRILVSSGLVLHRTLGPAYVFQANRESYLYRTLKELFQSEQGLSEELMEAIRSSLGSVATSVVVFGSYARATPRRSSDLDVLVVAPDAGKARERLARLELRFLRRYGLHVDAKVLTPAELKAKASVPYIRAARSEGILVIGQPLEKVMSSGH